MTGALKLSASYQEERRRTVGGCPPDTVPVKFNVRAALWVMAVGVEDLLVAHHLGHVQPGEHDIAEVPSSQRVQDRRCRPDRNPTFRPASVSSGP